MELAIELIWAFVAGGAVGAVAGWACLSIKLGHLRADLGRTQGAEKARSQELAAARGNAEAWRERLQAEQVARARLEAEARRVAELQPELHQVRGQLAAAMAETAALQAELAEQAQAHAEEPALLGQVRGEIEKDLKPTAVDALQANQGSFVQLANEVFAKHKAGAAADLEARHKAVETLIAPLQETLQGYRQHVEELEKARAAA